MFGTIYADIVRQLVLWDSPTSIPTKMEASSLGVIVLYLIIAMYLPAKLDLLAILVPLSYFDMGFCGKIVLRFLV